MKRNLWLIGALLLAVPCFAALQGAPAPGKMPPPGGGQRDPQARFQAMQKAREQIFAKLNLTPDQKKKIAALDKEMADKRKALFEKYMKQNGSAAQKMAPAKATGKSPEGKGTGPQMGGFGGPPPPEMMAQMRGMRGDYDKKLQAILTKDQAAQYQKLWEAERSKFGRGGMGRPTGPRG